MPGLRQFSLKFGLIAPLVPPLVASIMGFACLELLRDLQSAAWLSADSQGLLHPTKDARLGQEPFPAAELAGRVALKLPVSLLLSVIFSMGEEIGWRGFLQPRLSRSYGVRGAACLTAVIWALWHTGFHVVGVGFPAHLRLLGVLFAGPALLIGLGTFNGWPFARTRSIWVVAMCHASANTWSQFPLQFVDVPTDVEGAVLSAIAAGFLLLGAVAYFFLEWPAPPSGKIDQPRRPFTPRSVPRARSTH